MYHKNTTAIPAARRSHPRSRRRSHPPTVASTSHAASHGCRRLQFVKLFLLLVISCVARVFSRLIRGWSCAGGSMLYACACVRCGLFNIWCVVLPSICFGFGAGKMHAPLRSRARSRAVSVFKNQAAHHLMIIFSFWLLSSVHRRCVQTRLN